MSHVTLNQLSDETVRLISSTQIITSVSTAVKELIENSLDAGSRCIQVRLENFGYDTLEVKDDGHGVSYDNVQKMFLPSYTSKISCIGDLEKLETYGFRGEALAALAKLSNITVTTKTSSDTLAMTYVISNEGAPLSSKPSHVKKGTIITITNLFRNLPVRKQYLSSKRKLSEEIKNVENVVKSLSAIHPDLSIHLFHNKTRIWQKNAVKDLKQSFMQVVGLKVVSKMEYLNELRNNMMVDLLIPKKNMDVADDVLTNSNRNVFLYVNKRPVILKKVCKVVMEHVFLHYAHLNSKSKYAICLISVEVPPQEIDVNLEPNKTDVFLKNEDEVINLIDYMLSSYFGQKINRPEPELEPEPADSCGGKHDSSDDEKEDEDTDEEAKVGKSKIILNKRPKLGKDEREYIGTLRNKEFTERNPGWQLNIIHSNDPPTDNSLSNICSQINSENCTLTTQQEVGELKKLLHINNQKLVTSVGMDSDERLKDKDEIQNYDGLKIITKKLEEPAVPPNQKPELPSWPIREIVVKPKPVEPVAVNIAEEINEDKNSPVEVNDFVDLHDLDNIDLSDWSKGTVQTEKGLLPGGVTLLKPNPDTHRNLGVSASDIEKFDLSMQSVSSQMGRKELSAFTKYARIMRPNILKEYPGIMFTKVAGLLVERWKALTVDERKYYEKLAETVDAKRKIHIEQKSSDNAPKLAKKPKVSVKELRHVLEITASFETIIRKREKKLKSEAGNDMQLIGQLQPSGNWLYRKGSEIGHVRHYGLQELILSQKMLSNHIVPRQPVSKPILISEDILGKELWEILIRLEREYDPVSCKYIVVSPVISKNGFKIALEKRNDVIDLGWITEVASMIPFYGIAELKDTLNVCLKEGEFTELSSLRPVAVINYITNEAIRIVHQTPRPPDSKDIKEWIDIWQIGLAHLPPQCLHCREIFVPIYHINSDGSNFRPNSSNNVSSGAKPITGNSLLPYDLSVDQGNKNVPNISRALIYASSNIIPDWLISFTNRSQGKNVSRGKS